MASIDCLDSRYVVVVGEQIDDITLEWIIMS